MARVIRSGVRKAAATELSPPRRCQWYQRFSQLVSCNDLVSFIDTTGIDRRIPLDVLINSNSAVCRGL